MPKEHKQILVNLRCGVRTMIDKNIAPLVGYLNTQGIETRHSCQGTKRYKAYVSMFATPLAKEMAHHLLENHGELDLDIELRIHPHGYEGLTIRFLKKDTRAVWYLVKRFFVDRSIANQSFEQMKTSLEVK